MIILEERKTKIMSNYKIENESFEVQISLVGAEICSFKSKKSGKEYMWQGNPEIWGSHAPVLFPIVGGLKEDIYIYEGQKYHLPRHGFIRKNKDLKLITHTSNKLVLQLESSPSLKENYPFDFVFEISFSLLQNELEIHHRVLNTGKQNMYFSLGAHPTFNCPLEEGKKYEDYHLKFEQKEYLKRWNLNASGQIAEEGELVMDHSHQINLTTSLFDTDAIIFKSLKSRQVSLCEQEREIIRLRFDDFKSLGLWAKPAAPFICIEPWLGYADSTETNQQIKDKEGILSLESGKDFSANYTIEIFEP